MRITARQEPREGGLAGVCQGPRGFIISVDGKKVGRVAWARSMSRDTGYWYFYASGPGIPTKNTASDLPRLQTREDARDACMAYVREHMNIVHGIAAVLGCTTPKAKGGKR